MGRAEGGWRRKDGAGRRVEVGGKDGGRGGVRRAEERSGRVTRRSSSMGFGMSEDRTQPASKRRPSTAREHGQAAHSPELTAAVGWVAAVALLGFFGDDLAVGMIGLVRGSLLHPAQWPDDAGAVAAHVRGIVAGLLWPLAAILGGFAMLPLAAHQLQVGRLWATSQIVPDPKRLWNFAKGTGLSTRFVQFTWSVTKGIIVVVVAAWMFLRGLG